MGEKCQKCALVLLALIQLLLCILALALPDLIVGNISRGDAEEFMEGPPEDVQNATQIVHAHIGYFKSFINGIFDGSNREGMVGVFGFALLSTLSSFFTLLYTIQLLSHDVCPCQEKCAERCKVISEQLSKLAKTNFSAGVSGTVAAAMTFFTTEDLDGGNVGANFYLQIFGSVVSVVIHLVKTICIKQDGDDTASTSPNNAEHEENQV